MCLVTSCWGPCDELAFIPGGVVMLLQLLYVGDPVMN